MKQIGRHWGKNLKDDPKCNLDTLHFRIVSTWQTFSFNASCKKEEEKDVDPNEKTKTLMLFDE
jgi:hypothetical protein